MSDYKKKRAETLNAKTNVVDAMAVALYEVYDAGYNHGFRDDAGKEVHLHRGELEDRIEVLELENMCDACAGTGEPESDLKCMCEGTGKMSVAAVYLRNELVETSQKLDNITKQRDYLRTVVEEAYKLCKDVRTLSVLRTALNTQGWIS